jgi:hypothetical protein
MTDIIINGFVFRRQNFYTSKRLPLKGKLSPEVGAADRRQQIADLRSVPGTHCVTGG